MAPDASTTAVLAPLEAHAEAQVTHLLAVAAVVRELQASEAQYAQGYNELPSQIPTDIQQTLEQLPQLRRVCSGFSLLVRDVAAAKASLASALATDVLDPLIAFTTEHGEKARHLLSELFELLQREKAFDVAYQQLHEQSESSGESQDEEDRQQLQQTHMARLLQKRDAERNTIQQWITALHFADQRYAAQVHDVVKRTLAVYDRMIASSTALVDSLQTELRGDVGDAEQSNNCEQSWTSLVDKYDCHIAVTSWMIEVFRQLVPVEQKTMKSLQKVLKLDRAASKGFNSVGFSARLRDLSEYHELLTVNVAEPILRTLKFSKEKQERMRKELVKTVEETCSLVCSARDELSTKLSSAKDGDPIRCDSLTSSETSETCEIDNQNGDDDSVVDDASESTAEQIHLEAMEQKLTTQTREVTFVLEQTSFLAVKTMELILQDHLKHVRKALSSLSESIHAEAPTSRGVTDKPEQPWKHITEMLSICVDSSSSREEEREPNVITDDSPRRLQHRRISALKAPQLGGSVHRPSFRHTAVSIAHFILSIVCWAVVALIKFVRAQLPPTAAERVVVAGIAVVIFTMTRVCLESSRLESSWSDLAGIQTANSQDLEEIVKRSIRLCTPEAMKLPTT